VVRTPAKKLASLRLVPSRSGRFAGQVNDGIPHTSRWLTIETTLASRTHPARGRRKLPPAPGNPRNAQNALLSPVIPAYSRLVWRHQDRPVTPEVAGSSPVAPVKRPANAMLCCPSRRQIEADYTLFRGATRNGQKRPEKAAGVAILSRFRPGSVRLRSRRATARKDRRQGCATRSLSPAGLGRRRRHTMLVVYCAGIPEARRVPDAIRRFQVVPRLRESRSIPLSFTRGVGAGAWYRPRSAQSELP
jgi:hypothetical protein